MFVDAADPQTSKTRSLLPQFNKELAPICSAEKEVKQARGEEKTVGEQPRSKAAMVAVDPIRVGELRLEHGNAAARVARMLGHKRGDRDSSEDKQRFPSRDGPHRGEDNDRERRRHERRSWRGNNADRGTDSSVEDQAYAISNYNRQAGFGRFGDDRAIDQHGGSRGGGHSFLFMCLVILPFFCLGVVVTVKAAISVYKKRSGRSFRPHMPGYQRVRGDSCDDGQPLAIPVCEISSPSDGYEPMPVKKEVSSQPSTCDSDRATTRPSGCVGQYSVGDV